MRLGALAGARGYRSLPLCGERGTPIELARLLVHVDVGEEVNAWMPAERLREQLWRQEGKLRQLEAEREKVGAAIEVVARVREGV